MMKTRWRGDVRRVMVVCSAWALAVSAGATRADFIFENPTDEGNRQISGSPPTTAVTTGALPLLDVIVSNATQTNVDSDPEFDLQAVSTFPRGATISSAILSLTIAGAQAGTGPASVSVNGYGDGDGLIGAGDFLKPTTFLGGTGSLPNGATGSLAIPLTLDVTSFLQGLVNNKTPFVGFHLEGPSNDSSAFVFGGGAANSAERPSLAITFAATPAVPEPASVLLLALGLGGLAVLAWCRFQANSRRAGTGRYRLLSFVWARPDRSRASA